MLPTRLRNLKVRQTSFEEGRRNPGKPKFCTTGLNWLLYLQGAQDVIFAQCIFECPV